MTIYLKGFNYKICRRGLLERGQTVRKSFGDFKKLENEFVQKASQKCHNIDELLKEIREKKAIQVEKEIKSLTNAITALSRTMENVKKEVKTVTDEGSFER